VMNAGQIEQLGPPEAVYHQPETRFVAEFIGRSDFLPGRVTENGIHTDLGHILQPVDAPLESVVAILLRPDDVVLEPAGAGPANGHVLSRQFMGIDHLYQVCLPDGTILHSRQPHTLHLSESEPVQVGLTTDHPFPCFLGRKAV
jgi:iron(III) transport system ATP-binding protein